MDQGNNPQADGENLSRSSNSNTGPKSPPVDEITTRLNRMNVEMESTEVEEVEMQTDGRSFSMESQEENYYSALMERDESIAIEEELKRNSRSAQLDSKQGTSDILIVTNVDPSVFHDQQMRSKFESLFLQYDSKVTFRYLKSFRRVRLDFSDWQRAEVAKRQLARYQLGQSEFRCYTAQMIRPSYLSASNNNSNNSDDYLSESNQREESSIYLNIPKLTKQFLISPPASPPVGWEPVTEQSPCIDVQLLSAIVNLVPGKVHEIHAGSESQPGIFVEVCEDPTFEKMSMKSCSRIPRTMSPANFCQPVTPFAGSRNNLKN